MFLQWMWTTLLFWSPSGIEVLCSIACFSTVHNGLPVSIAFCHLVERLSVQLYWYNAKMILHFWALDPYTWRIFGWRPALVGTVTACIYLMIAMILLMLLMIKIQVERIRLTAVLLICSMLWIVLRSQLYITTQVTYAMLLMFAINSLCFL